MAVSTMCPDHRSFVEITDKQAFIAMRLFLEHFYNQAGNDMETLIADITLASDGQPNDPAAWTDWQRSVAEAKGLTP